MGSCVNKGEFDAKARKEHKIEIKDKTSEEHLKAKPHGHAATGKVNVLPKSCMHRSRSMGDMKKSIRIDDTNEIVRIHSHTDLSKMEKESIWFQKSEMKSFVSNEISRRRAIGETSMASILPESEVSTY